MDVAKAALAIAELIAHEILLMSSERMSTENQAYCGTRGTQLLSFVGSNTV